jgi:fatty acid-binding protein DegV
MERDARFRSASEALTKIVLDLKRMALEGSPPQTVIDALRQARADISVEDEEA